MSWAWCTHSFSRHALHLSLHGGPCWPLELVIPHLLLKNTLDPADVPAAHQSSAFT